MTSFLAEQGDIVLCSQSVAMFFLAVVSLLLGGKCRIQAAWKWFGLFACVAGISRGAEVFIPLLQSPHTLTDTVWLLRVLALVALLEFGRRSGCRTPPWLTGALYGALALIAVSLPFWVIPDWLLQGALFLLYVPAAIQAFRAMSQEAVPGALMGGRRWMGAGMVLLLLFLLASFVLIAPSHAWRPVVEEGHTIWLHGLELGVPFALAPLASLWLFLGLYAASPRRAALYFLAAVPLMPLVMVLGGVLMLWSTTAEESDRRMQLVSRTCTTASALDEHLVGQLTATESDAHTPAFAQLREALHRVHDSNGEIRFVYLLAMHGTQVVFMADAEPENSKDYSPPGQVYDEVSALVREKFQSGRPFLDGPYRDRWGQWISGYAPIFRSGDPHPIALLGMDVAVSSWQNIFYVHRLPGLGLTVFISLLILAMLASLFMAKESATEVAASEARFRTLIEHAPEAVIVVSIADGRLLEMNAALIKWLGYTADELKGKTIFDIALKDPRMIREHMLAAWQADAPSTVESVYRRKDGETIPVEITQTHFPARDRAVLLAYVRDISERKRAEDRIQHTMQELERFNRLMVGREMRVLELKREVNDLARALGQPPVYLSVESGTTLPGRENA